VYRTVIVPLDGSPRAEAAVPVAASFARRAMAEVDLITVREAGGSDLAYLEKVLPHVTAEIGMMATRPGTDAAAAIVDYARSRPSPLICMTTHARGTVGELLLGSVAEAVVRESDLPVLLVGPHVRRDPVPSFDLMLVCLDGSDLAESILPVARDWHQVIGTKPWLLQVEDPTAAETIRRLGLTDDVQETGYLRRVAISLEEAGVAADYDIVHARHPAHAIARFAEDLPASVIAVATHSRVGLKRAVLGSVAMGIVHDATCPVLVVRGQE